MGEPARPMAVKLNALLRFGFNIEIDRARRDHRGNGVLVHHLGDRIAQQNDVLIKRFDMALQLDAVDQIDRDWNMLFAQGIEEWVL